MRDTRKADARNMTRRGVNALEIPDRFARVGVEFFRKQPAAVMQVENTSETPWMVGERLDVEDIDYDAVRTELQVSDRARRWEVVTGLRTD